jgi:hypothetical protein
VCMTTALALRAESCAFITDLKKIQASDIGRRGHKRSSAGSLTLYKQVLQTKMSFGITNASHVIQTPDAVAVSPIHRQNLLGGMYWTVSSVCYDAVVFSCCRNPPASIPLKVSEQCDHHQC